MENEENRGNMEGRNLDPEGEKKRENMYLLPEDVDLLHNAIEKLEKASLMLGELRNDQ